ncbi:MAG: hypothetical protein WCF26_01900 [Candidatus Sulfotelmatobacter sp.]
MEPDYSRALQAEGGIPQPGSLIRAVHSLYRDEFLRWFGIMAPTSLLSGLVLILADLRIRAIFRSIPLGEIRHHFVEIAVADALRFGGFFLSWLLGCFALAAIATVVNSLNEADDNAEAWRHDSYEEARKHLGALFVTALITFCAFLVGALGVEIVDLAVVRVVGWTRFSPFNYFFTVAGFVVVGSIVSWWAIAVPLIVGGNIKMRTALRKSVQLSSGYEGALFLLVTESVAGGLIAWYVTLHGMALLVPEHLRYTAWYGWFVNVVGVLASAAVDPPLFIGLSVLVDPKRHNATSIPVAQEAADIH